MHIGNPQSEFRNRPGFTVVELLVVIVVIAVLVALLLPAIGSVRRTARIAQVKTDISDLETAISNFKATYGVTPPSQITLYPAGSTWDPRSQGIIRRIWPQFNFAASGGLSISNPITLNGAECLMFFLGGIPDSSGALDGFSKNPATPFASGGNRQGPFTEIEGGIQGPGQTTGRVSDIDTDGFPEYLDPLPNQTMPYLYFSSYDGSGYNAADNPQMNDVYRRGPGSNAQAYKSQSYQIISPGFDGPIAGNPYGDGGFFDPDDPSASLNMDAERDNITNFHGGTLAD